MKVSLVYCAIGIAGFNSNRPLGDREGSWIGHGIASIAASTKTYGHDVDIIDLRQLSGWDEFVKIIAANPADVYGLSVAPVDHYTALKAVHDIKVTLPEAKIIIGGIHPSIFPEMYDFKVIDTVVIGEGEITFPQLLTDVDSLPRKVQGVKPDLDFIPWVDRELFDYRRELSCFFAPGQQLPSVTMIAGRGCPYKCAYCQPAENAVFGRPFRIRKPVDVILELEDLDRKYHYKSITFWDDTFTFSREFCMQFANLYKESNLKATIAACSRADIICRNEDMIARLAEIGVNWLVIGFESGSQRILDFIDKGVTVEQNIEAARICTKYGINIFATFMLGLPTESKDEALQTIKMIHKIKPAMASPFWYNPIPGTKLYEYCNNNDLILDKDLSIARTGQFHPTLKNIDYQYLWDIMGPVSCR